MDTTEQAATTDPVELTRQIREGQLDAFLDGIESVIRKRRADKMRERAALLAEGRPTGLVGVGSTVRFNGRTRPQYLVGLTATVLKVNPSTYKVLLDAGTVGRFGGDREIRVPKTLVDPA